MQRVALTTTLLIVAVATVLPAQETERLFLSGTDPDDAVEWEFSIDRGRGSGEWTTIPVPSQWELEGFGEYAYGHDDEVRAEVGSYRTRFRVPEEWRGRHIQLVFEGAMTDVEAELNGDSVGERHRGGFTRFSYDVTSLLRFGDADNLLEVNVSEASDDRSVNAAERDADYWVFGGIYRPVYLESRAASGIHHVAIDARHDGNMRVEVEVDDDSGDLERGVLELNLVVMGSAGERLGALRSRAEGASGGRRLFVGRVAGAVPWSAESPRLYTLEVELSKRGEVLHRVSEEFGFRTVEVRPGDGLFVNGRRTLLKGINRHSFWPESGRALTRAQNRRDAELIKELNANAVRASHYPPDVAFLEACDELGLYVIDELPGWHDAYNSGVGRKLVGELVRRDVNHPSVILWANGNEGGWNSSLDAEFGRHDLQGRSVLHPQSIFGGFDTTHYPTWEELRAIVAGEGVMNWLRGWLGPLPLVMPTEMLHGLYDGGLGAGLADYWQLIRSSPRGAGGFLWAFLDEAVVRSDRGGELDSFGNYAPDGIVGPYRKREASFATVRSVWSPVALLESRADTDSLSLSLENRFEATDLSACRFQWRWLRWPGPGSSAEVEVLGIGEESGPAAAPGRRGELVVPLEESADALELTAVDSSGRSVETWVVSVTERSDLVRRWLSDVEGEEGRPIDAASALESLGLEAPRSLPSAVTMSWRVYPSRWLRVEFNLDVESIVFPQAMTEDREVSWLGRGPTPVWQNRLEGPNLGLWTGLARPGFYDDVLWAGIADGSSALQMIVEGAGLFVGLSAPRFPEDARSARADVPPPGSLSVLSSIPAMGSKFHTAEELGPPRVQRTRTGPVAIWFRRDFF